MAQRSSGSAVISFGLLSIPVKQYITASSDATHFNMINPKTTHRVKQLLVDSQTGDEVARSTTINGFEYEKDKYITFTDEELVALEGPKSNTIEMVEVVPRSQINISPGTVEKTLYLTPNKSDKAYKLLLLALKETEKVAVCKFYSRGKDTIAALAPVGDMLMMFILYYATELRKVELPDNPANPSEKEVALAKLLLGQLSKDKFNLSDYTNQYAERLKSAIETKLAGGLVEAIKNEESSSPFDLEAMLAASLAPKEQSA